MDLNGIFRRLLRNAGLLIGTRALFGLVNLATSAIAVRAFGLGDLGLVLLLHAYARLFADIGKFQSWQAVLRYGAALDEVGDHASLRRLLGFTLAVDLGGAALALGGALLLLPWAGGLFAWPPEVAGFAPAFVLCIPFLMQATPHGILRLCDRVDVLAAQHGANAVLRLLGTLAAILLDGSVGHLVLAWFAASVLSGALVMAAAWRELARRDLMPVLRVGWRSAGRAFPGIWRFMLTTNVSSSVQLGVGSLTTMIVGARLGAEAAGAFEIARQLAVSVGKPARVLGPLIFPDLSRIAAREDWRSMREVMTRQLRVTGVVAAAAAALVFVAVGPVVALVYGEALAGEVWLFRLLIAGALVGAVGFALEPAILSANRPGLVLGLQLGALALYLGILAWLLGAFGLAGAGAAVMTHAILYHGALAWAGAVLLRGRIAVGSAAPDVRAR